jgi:hypothetical protein
MGRASWTLRRIRDQAVASDPGMTRLQSAASAAVAMTAALGVEYAFARLTSAGAQDTTVAMLLGAVTAMMGSMALTGTGVWPKVRTAVCFPVSMGLGLLLGIAVAPRTDLMLAVFVVVMFAAVFVRRFGIPFFTYGFMTWMGYFFATFLHATLGMLPDLMVAVLIASIVVLLLSLTILRISPANTVTRTRRAFDARARAVARVCTRLLEAGVTEPVPADRWLRKVRAAQTRLAESALMIEAWSAEIPALSGVTAASLRRTALDAQLAIDTLVTTCENLHELPDDEAPLLVDAACVTGLFAHGDYPAAGRAADELLAKAGASAVRHVAASILEYLELVRQADNPAAPGTADDEEFEPAVTLAMGNLPGSAAVAGGVAPRGRSWNPLRRLDLTTRQAVQVAVAGALAILVGRELSETRYYWAVIASFVAFAGTATRSEVFVKSVNRVVGTLVGIGAGIGLAHLTAGKTMWVLVVIVGSMFLGFYLQRLSYAYMIFFMTIMVSQLYSALHEFSAGLLVLRLEETTLGAAIGIAVALLLTPLSTRDTVTNTERTVARILADLLRTTADRIEDRPGTQDPDAQARRLDDSLRQLLLVAAPLVGVVPWGSGSRHTRHRLTLFSAVVRHTRRLVSTVRRQAVADRALAVPARALAEVAAALAEAPDRPGEELLDQLSLAEMALAQPWSSGAEPVLRELIHLRQLLHEVATGDVPGQLADTASAVAAKVRGHVRASEGSGVNRAALTLINARGRQVARAVSQVDGRFQLDAPGPGAYVLITAADAHVPAASTVLVRRSGGDVVTDVLLADTGGVTGTVTMAHGGAAVPGAVATLTDAHGAVAGSRRTDADGYYAFNAVEGGEYTLVVSADLHRPHARTIVVRSGEDVRADVALAGVARLSGTATTGPAGCPVAGARITLLDAMDSVVAVADTDESGRYVFEDLPAGEYTALATGYPPSSSALHLPGHPLTFHHDVELKHP